MNVYSIIVVAIILSYYLLEQVIRFLNISHCSDKLPSEFRGYYDPEKYRKSQRYLKEKGNFNFWQDTFFTLLILLVIVGGGFNLLDKFIRSFEVNPVLRGLLFVGIIYIVLDVIKIPFNFYNTFKIESRYGFNRTSLTTFIGDIFKKWLLVFIIGGISFTAVLWLFSSLGTEAWFYCWGVIVLFQVFIIFIAPAVIMPLFNKFLPLENQELKKSIKNYARSQNFKIQGIFKVDASRRSTKANAFFTGFGRFRRIGLFDTLLENHTNAEIVAVLAHEIGHYKKKHVLVNIIISIITTGIMFYLLSRFVLSEKLFMAFKTANISFYAGIVFFSLVYRPISLVFDVISNWISRYNEYQADNFAVQTHRHPAAFIEALKKLTVENLSNLNPHPLKVFFDYSHPPILARINKIREKNIEFN